MNNQKILAVIPARRGSKGLKNKNIRLLAGKPLMAYTILAALKSEVFDEVFVSTDSEEYARIALEYGASVPFLRDGALAGDTASSWSVVMEALEKYAQMGRIFDTVILLQPTSPLRNAEDIKEALAMFHEKECNAVVSVCEAEHSPLWMNTLPPDYSMTGFIRKDICNKRRQDIPCYYRINGAIYIVRSSYLREGCDIYRDRCYAFIMPKERSVDIDAKVDFVLAEVLLK